MNKRLQFVNQWNKLSNIKLMKKYIFLVIFTSLISGLSCKTDKDNTPKSKLLILKLSYDSANFEGGVEMVLSKNANPVTFMPINVIYNRPMDFGDITFKYAPTGETVFAGTIIWNGEGKIAVPAKFLSQDHFERVKDYGTMPEKLDSLPNCESYQSLGAKRTSAIWSSIGNLSLVKKYIDQKCRMTVYLYRPSVGLFNPAVAKWIVFLYRE
jgi:hypothetical protein